MDIPLEWLGAYLAACNLVAFLMTVVDKSAARRGLRRIPERTLMLVAAVGGAPLMLATMRLIRHKTRHKKFMVGLPLFLVAQAGLLVWLWSKGVFL